MSRDDLAALGPPSPAVFEAGLPTRRSSNSLLSPLSSHTQVLALPPRTHHAVAQLVWSRG